MDIKYIYLRRAHPELLTQYPDLHLEEKFCFDFDTIANDPEINIVVEVMGGIEPAYHFVKPACKKEKCRYRKQGADRQQGRGTALDCKAKSCQYPV